MSFAIGDETSAAILTLFDDAKENIYLSLPNLDWNVLLKSAYDDQKYLFYNVVQKACERGVTVHLLVGEDFLRSYSTRPPPPKCFVRYVNRFGPKIRDETILWYFEYLFHEKLDDGTIVSLGDKSIFFHNQRYLVIDESVAMIGSFDLSLHPNLSGAFQDQKMKYYPISALVKPDRKFLDFVQLNWNSMGISTMPVSNRFFFGGRFDPQHAKNQDTKVNIEYDAIIAMIMNAKKSILIQTQFLSSHQDTENKVIEALATRLAKAHQDGLKKDPFRCILLTNIDCSQDSRNFYCTRETHLTSKYMLDCFRKLGISDPLVFKEEKRLFVGSVTSSHEQIYFEGTLLIKDENTALITSSSIHDFSIGPRRCSELGVIVRDGEQNQLVANLFHQLMQDHLALLDYKGKTSEMRAFDEYVSLCYQNKGKVKRYRLCSERLQTGYRWADWLKRLFFGDDITFSSN